MWIFVVWLDLLIMFVGWVLFGWFVGLFWLCSLSSFIGVMVLLVVILICCCFVLFCVFAFDLFYWFLGGWVLVVVLTFVLDCVVGVVFGFILLRC